VLFARVDERHVGPLRLIVPDVRSLDVLALALATSAAIAILRTKLGPFRVLAASAAIGLVMRGLLGV